MPQHSKKPSRAGGVGAAGRASEVRPRDAVAAGETGRHGSSRDAAAGMFAVLILVILILEFLRRPEAFTWPTLYAEDGYVFYRDQLVHPSWKTLLEPFTVDARYYLPIPRLAACLSQVVATRFVPWVFNGVGLLAGAL